MQMRVSPVLCSIRLLLFMRFDTSLISRTYLSYGVAGQSAELLWHAQDQPR